MDLLLRVPRWLGGYLIVASKRSKRGQWRIIPKDVQYLSMEEM